MKNTIKVTLQKATEKDVSHKVLEAIIEAMRDTAHEMLDKTGVVLILETPEEKQ